MMEIIDKILYLILILLSSIQVFSQTMTREYSEYDIAIDFFITKKHCNTVFLFHSPKKQEDISLSKINTNFFYVDMIEDIIYEKDSITFCFRTYSGQKDIIETQNDIIHYEPECIRINYAWANGDSLLITEYQNIQGVEVYLAKKSKTKARNNKYKIISKLGMTNTCGNIHLSVPFVKGYILVFYKKGFTYENVILWRCI